MLNKQIIELVKKEIVIEFRQMATFGGILTYIIASTFILALTFNKVIQPATWNALYWIIFVFSSITICGKSFSRETKGTSLFNYLNYQPIPFITAKLIYNFLFLLFISFLSVFFYAWFVGFPVDNISLFILLVVLTSIGFSGALTLMSAIASKAGNNITMMSILSFPVIIPILVLSLRIGKQAIDGLNWTVSTDFLLTLGSLDAISVVLCLLLFPYLWRA